MKAQAEEKEKEAPTVALVVDLAFASTADSTVSDDTWTSLLGGPKTITGLGFNVQILGYVLNLDSSNVDIRIVVDGTEVVKGSPDAPLMYVINLGIGTHTVDFQAKAHDENPTAGPRGLTVLDLGV